MSEAERTMSEVEKEMMLRKYQKQMRSGLTAKSIEQYQHGERIRLETEWREQNDRAARARLAQSTLPRSVLDGLRPVKRCGCSQRISASANSCRACAQKV